MRERSREVMIRYGLLLTAVVALSWVWWTVGRHTAEPPEPREPTQAERIIEYCSVPVNRSSPLCSVKDPTDDEAVEDAVRDIVEQPRVIERETVRERDNDSDDDPAVVVVPDDDDSEPAPSRTNPPAPAPTTRPPLAPDLKLSEVNPPNLDFPLLP